MILSTGPQTDPSLEIFVSWKLPKKLTIQNIDEVNALSFLLRPLSMGTLEAFRYVVDEFCSVADGRNLRLLTVHTAGVQIHPRLWDSIAPNHYFDAMGFVNAQPRHTSGVFF